MFIIDKKEEFNLKLDLLLQIRNNYYKRIFILVCKYDLW